MLTDELRVRVAAAGLNPFDNAVINGYLKDRMEHRFPLVPGMDAAGVIEAVGEGVTGVAAGDRVVVTHTAAPKAQRPELGLEAPHLG